MSIEFLGKNPIKTIEEAQKVIDFVRLQYQENGIGRWAVLLKENHEFIGWAGLKLVKEEINGHKDFYDLGYRFIKNFWQKGYGYEAAKACLDYAFTEMHLKNVYAHAMIGNEGSKRILKKIGMQNTGTFFMKKTNVFGLKSAGKTICFKSNSLYYFLRISSPLR